jgi:peptide-methionine (S)-S-oxide reductase
MRCWARRSAQLAGPGQAEALFGCGCFWGAEKGFWRLPGVVTTAVGYAGGRSSNPSYQQVCSGSTGHAEVVRVVWDQSRLHFSDLLKLFWECHDPTQGDRQGNDRGSQYRSAIYVSDAHQMELAEASRAGLPAAAEFRRLRRHHHRDRAAATASLVCGALPPAVPGQTGQPALLLCPAERPACSATSTAAAYQLDNRVWQHYDWSINHCVLRGENAPIAGLIRGACTPAAGPEPAHRSPLPGGSSTKAARPSFAPAWVGWCWSAMMPRRP